MASRGSSSLAVKPLAPLLRTMPDAPPWPEKTLHVSTRHEPAPQAVKSEFCAPYCKATGTRAGRAPPSCADSSDLAMPLRKSKNVST